MARMKRRGVSRVPWVARSMPKAAKISAIYPSNVRSWSSETWRRRRSIDAWKMRSSSNSRARDIGNSSNDTGRADATAAPAPARLAAHRVRGAQGGQCHFNNDSNYSTMAYPCQFAYVSLVFRTAGLFGAAPCCSAWSAPLARLRSGGERGHERARGAPGCAGEPAPPRDAHWRYVRYL